MRSFICALRLNQLADGTRRVLTVCEVGDYTLYVHAAFAPSNRLNAVSNPPSLFVGRVAWIVLGSGLSAITLGGVSVNHLGQL